MKLEVAMCNEMINRNAKRTRYDTMKIAMQAVVLKRSPSLRTQRHEVLQIQLVQISNQLTLCI